MSKLLLLKPHSELNQAARHLASLNFFGIEPSYEGFKEIYRRGFICKSDVVHIVDFHEVIEVLSKKDELLRNSFECMVDYLTNHFGDFVSREHDRFHKMYRSALGKYRLSEE